MVVVGETTIGEIVVTAPRATTNVLVTAITAAVSLTDMAQTITMVGVRATNVPICAIEAMAVGVMDVINQAPDPGLPWQWELKLHHHHSRNQMRGTRPHRTGATVAMADPHSTRALDEVAALVVKITLVETTSEATRDEVLALVAVAEVAADPTHATKGATTAEVEDPAAKALEAEGTGRGEVMRWVTGTAIATEVTSEGAVGCRMSHEHHSLTTRRGRERARWRCFPGVCGTLVLHEVAIWMRDRPNSSLSLFFLYNFQILYSLGVRVNSDTTFSIVLDMLKSCDVAMLGTGPLVVDPCKYYELIRLDDIIYQALIAVTVVHALFSFQNTPFRVRALSILPNRSVDLLACAPASFRQCFVLTNIHLLSKYLPTCTNHTFSLNLASSSVLLLLMR